MLLPVVVTLTSLLIICCILLKLFTRLTIGRCTCNSNLAGKTALITGGNSGLGYQTALALAGRGCRVIIADKDNCDKTKEEIINKTGNSNIVTKYFNLASLSSVRELAKDLSETEARLDILINNAGIGGVGNIYTEDRLNMGMQINHFGPFLLTHLLIGLLKKSAPSRILFVSSFAALINNLTIKNLNYPKEEFNSWSDTNIYANSKLCNIIVAKELAKQLHGTGVTANSLNPGFVQTPIFEKSTQMGNGWLILTKTLSRLIAKNSQEGAQTAIHLAISKEVEKVSGKYFSDCRPSMQPSKARDDLFIRNIWEASEEYVKLSPEEKL